MNAKIEIAALGYETYSVVLPKTPSKVTKLEILQAKIEFEKLNDAEDIAGLAFHRISQTSEAPTIDPFSSQYVRIA